MSLKNLFLQSSERWAEGVSGADGESTDWKWIWDGGEACGGRVASVRAGGGKRASGSGVSFGNAVAVPKSGDVGEQLSGLSGLSTSGESERSGDDVFRD